MIFLFTYVPPLSEHYGKLETRLFLGQGKNQPLVVAFGGGSGGNDWARDYLQDKRDSLHRQGYAVLAIGYFNTSGTPKYLDRISLNAISDTIKRIASHPSIDDSKIALMGGSRGGELVLNLASRFKHFGAVIALSTSHVTFPAITLTSNTSSWMIYDEEVPYVPAPLKIIGPALKGDLFTAHSMMLEDMEASAKAEIPVENIHGPILLLSGRQDEQWPATAMSDQLMNRLSKHEFPFFYDHIASEGGHVEPLNHFYRVVDFLKEHLPSDISLDE